MDKQKAERLDKILKELSLKTFQSKAEIEAKVGISIQYSDMHSINSQRYNGKGIVTTTFAMRKKLYKLTPDGSAFRVDVGFVNLQKTETREKRIGIINLIIAIISILIAAGSFMFAINQSNKQTSQYDTLEHRIESLEKIE